MFHSCDDIWKENGDDAEVSINCINSITGKERSYESSDTTTKSERERERESK